MNKKCKNCGKEFTLKLLSNGDYARNRKNCYQCSKLKERNLTHRTCSICSIKKPLSDFSGRIWTCKPCNSKRMGSIQRKTKQKCLDYKGRKCCICGYNKSTRALCFHHLDPNEKDFAISKYRTHAWDKVKAELDKCLLVCANCHAEIHDGLIEVGDEGVAPPTLAV